MNPSRFQQVKAIVLAASELAPAQRTAYLDEACAGDAELRRDVDALLAHDQDEPAILKTEGMGKALGSAAGDRLLGDSLDVLDTHPERIGPYRILEVLGEGGMGVVYRAEQTEPIQREVALKLIRRGLDTGQVVARFAAEQQVLALMDHPNIAKVLDAGSDEVGRPYFVMELVRGVPITEYCAQNDLSVAGRVELIHAICQAVQHAHNKGIIHRDLKPSNLLVAVQDGRPTPKVIDFGIAKALEESDFADSELGRAARDQQLQLTREGSPIGTIRYMSPEQARGVSSEIDVRSDIYSLGAIMYELLTGAVPFETTDGSLLAQVRLVCEQPPRPFKAVAPAGRHLDADLETIVRKALEKDPADRYQSAATLAGDIERYRSSQPILARPPSAVYQLRKLISRNKIPSFLVAGIVLMIIGASIWMSVLYLRSEANLRRALTAEGESENVTEFMIELFDVSHPAIARGDTITAREILDRGAEKIELELIDQPEIQARLMQTMGLVYGGLGIYDKSGSLLEGALAKSRETAETGTLAEAELLSDLANHYRIEAKIPEAEAAYQRTLEIRRQSLPPDDPLIAAALANLGWIHALQDRYDEARQTLTEAVTMLEQPTSPLSRIESLELASALNNLAIVYQEQGHFDRADTLFRRSMVMRDQLLLPDSQEIAESLQNLGSLYLAQRRYADAEPLLNRAIGIEERILGPVHPDLAASLINLAVVHRRLGRFEQAERLLQRALAIQERVFGPDHLTVSYSLNNLSFLYRTIGRFAEAEAALRRSLEIKRELLKAEHTSIATALNNLGELSVLQEHFAGSDTLFRQAHAIRKAAYGEEDFRTAQPLHNLGAWYLATGDLAAAEPLLLRALAVRDAARGPVHYRIAESLESCAELMYKLERGTQADSMLARATDIRAQLE